MNKISKIIFLVIAGVIPICIGSLHTIVHFNELVTPEIQMFLQQKFMILDKNQPLWYTWGIVSFMMGASSVVIGLLNITTIKKLKQNQYISFLSFVAMIIYQVCVTYVGVVFNQNFQFYGGILGVVLLVISMSLARVDQRKNTCD